jgi:hypothetical protein
MPIAECRFEMPTKRPASYAIPRHLTVRGLVEAAIREGRHEADITTWRTVCQVCREWVPAIWYVNEQGVRMCRGCAPKDRK